MSTGKLLLHMCMFAHEQSCWYFQSIMIVGKIVKLNFKLAFTKQFISSLQNITHFDQTNAIYTNTIWVFIEIANNLKINILSYFN